MLRPQRAAWFEVLVPHEAFADALSALAGSRAVEIEPAGVRGQHLIATRALVQGAERFRRLEADYAMFWPQVGEAPLPETSEVEPLHAMHESLAAIDQWLAESQRLINAVHHLDDGIREARLWIDVLQRLGSAGVPLGAIEVSGTRIEVAMCCGKEIGLPSQAQILSLPIVQGERDCLLLVARAGMLEGFHESHDTRCHAWPEWLRGREEPLDVAETRFEALELERAEATQRLKSVALTHALAQHVSRLRHLSWLADQLRTLSTTRHLVRLSGWAAIPLEHLEARLEHAGVNALVIVPASPPDKSPPLLLRHSRWIRPFETFVRALGMPGPHDADPTLLLAVAVPLLFGFMFGDVGHGLVFMLLGGLLLRRWPMARLLVWGGASAVVFGLLYGSVFTNETWLPPLWLHPLEHPVTVLAVSLGIGVGLLGSGLLLNVIQAWWQRDALGVSWLAEMGLILIYAGLLSAFQVRAMLWLALAGLALILVVAFARERRVTAVFAALGELIERLFQLLINTLSFLRVGAFALAHAGLASAVMSLAVSTELTLVKVLILLLGNVLILTIEGLVVSIQTTRLILFEFFVRFLKGGGRVFQPIEAPPHHRGVQRESP